MRDEIEHLRKLASLSTDFRVLAEIGKLITELERRVQKLENGEVGGHGT